MILSFRTDMPGQTVQTHIRLLLEEQSDQGLHCLPFRLHRLDSMVEPHSSNFRVITRNVLEIYGRCQRESKFCTAVKSGISIQVYRNFPKYLDTQKICCNHSKIWTMWLYHRVMSSNDADGIMANSVDPDQTSRSSLIWVCTVCRKLRIITVASLCTVLIKVIAKYFEVLRTCRGSIAMATIYVVMFDIIV